LSLCNKEDIKWDHDQNGVITITADIFNWWILFLCSGLWIALFTMQGMHIWVYELFQNQFLRLQHWNGYVGFSLAGWSSKYFGLPHDCEGQGYVLLWVVRKTQFLIREVLAMISTAVKVQTTNVLSLQHSILSEP
jgi:hypothetical protein